MHSTGLRPQGDLGRSPRAVETIERILGDNCEATGGAELTSI
jgi:hypothetical protein